jgi:hypothetical protein
MRTIIVIILSLLIWIFFYVENLPLKTEGTVIVLIVCIFLVFLVEKLFKKKRGENGKIS